MPTTCKSCGAVIRWITMPSGKSMPVDYEPVTYWEKPKAKGKIVTPNGMIISCEFSGDLQKATGVGFIPHWATCPKAAEHKRRE